jgi:hypothetical protein
MHPLHRLAAVNHHGMPNHEGNRWRVLVFERFVLVDF